MNATEAREVFNLAGHLVKVLLDENFHSHKATPLALKALEAKGYLAALKGDEVKTLVKAIENVFEDVICFNIQDKPFVDNSGNVSCESIECDECVVCRAKEALKLFDR